MKLFYDLDFQVLRDANLQAIEGLTLRYKDEVPLEIQFRRGNSTVEPAGVLLVPVVKLAGKFDSDPICPSVAFTQSGSSDTAKWTGNLVVDSAAIETALKDNADPTDDVAQFTASFQLYAEADGGESRSAILPATITNSLYRGSETFPVVVDGEGLYVLTASSSTAVFTNTTGNTTLTPAVAVRRGLIVGTVAGAARTSTVVLSVTGRALNDRFTLRLNIPATAGIVLDVTNATSGGPSLIGGAITTTSAPGQSLLLDFWFDGTAFQPLGLIYPTL